ncbi:MAG: putative motility protein [Armatimonadetes bacterium]|nr:putative motility protein [Armatimonadota bacterium]
MAEITQTAQANVQAKLQVGMLRKMLDAQQTEAAALMKMMEGKGQNVDLRV